MEEAGTEVRQHFLEIEVRMLVVPIAIRFLAAEPFLE